MSPERTNGKLPRARPPKIGTKKYTGILRDRLTLASLGISPNGIQEVAGEELSKRIKAEHDKRYTALFGFYGVKEPFTAAGWVNLAMALAEAHVPGFSIAKPPRRRGGNKPKLEWYELALAFVKVQELKSRRPQLSIRRACDEVWKRHFRGECGSETLRKNVLLLRKIPIKEVFSPMPTDPTVVAQFKAGLLEIMYLYPQSSPQLSVADPRK
jgi:hypothetical protein